MCRGKARSSARVLAGAAPEDALRAAAPAAPVTSQTAAPVGRGDAVPGRARRVHRRCGNRPNADERKGPRPRSRRRTIRGSRRQIAHGVAAVKGAGGAGAKNGPGAEVFVADGLPIAALGRHTAEIIAIACAVDTRRRILLGTPQHQWGDGAHLRIVEPLQRGFGPASLHLSIVVQEFNDGISRRTKTGIGRDAEAAALFQPARSGRLERIAAALETTPPGEASSTTTISTPAGASASDHAGKAKP